MSRTDIPTPTLSLDSQADETRMRRALGLTSGQGPVHQQRPDQARQRHKFAQDGSVPVVMLHRDGDGSGSKDRIASLGASLEAERTAHAATKRVLHELQAAHQALQTRLAHTTLAHSEALATERQARQAAEDDLATATIAASAVPVTASVAEVPLRVKRTAPGPRKPRANAAAPKEPKPVRWWTPSFRAKTKT